MDFDIMEKLDTAMSFLTSADTLRELAKEKSIEVRTAVAKNPNTPEDIQLYLTKDTVADLRRNVAKNPNSSSKVLVMLLEHEKNVKEPSRDVIRAIYRNPNLPYVAKVIIETLFEEWIKWIF